MSTEQDLINSIDIDTLGILFNKPFVINDYISLKQPSIGQIVQMGEQEYFSMIHTLTAIPSDMKSVLWDMGIDYEEISDYELFCMLAPTVNSEYSNLIFTEPIDFSRLERCINEENGELGLCDFENEILIDRLAYMKIVGYLRHLHGLKPKVEHAGNEDTKKLLIELDRDDRAKARNKKFESFFEPLVIAMVNTEEFKYNYETVQNLNIGAFLSSVQQIQVKKNALALLQGCYSGMIDTSKINKKDLMWIGK